MAMKRVFFCSIPSCNYLFKNGKPAIFINGEYYTDIASEIAELEAEISYGHPHISINADKREVDDTKLDPLAAIKAQAIKEYLAAEAIKDTTKDMGSTVSEKLNVNSSANIASETSASPLQARLASLNLKNPAPAAS
jgi:hypothetical protein